MIIDHGLAATRRIGRVSAGGRTLAAVAARLDAASLAATALAWPIALRVLHDPLTSLADPPLNLTVLARATDKAVQRRSEPERRAGWRPAPVRSRPDSGVHQTGVLPPATRSGDHSVLRPWPESSAVEAARLVRRPSRAGDRDPRPSGSALSGAAWGRAPASTVAGHSSAGPLGGAGPFDISSPPGSTSLLSSAGQLDSAEHRIPGAGHPPGVELTAGRWGAADSDRRRAGPDQSHGQPSAAGWPVPGYATEPTVAPENLAAGARPPGEGALAELARRFSAAPVEPVVAGDRAPTISGSRPVALEVPTAAIGWDGGPGPEPLDVLEQALEELLRREAERYGLDEGSR